MEKKEPHLILIDRYLETLKRVRPDVFPKKNKEGSLDLSHSLWMLNKMKEPDFVPLTSYSAWITWVQASFYLHGLINIRNEKSQTRDIFKQRIEQGEL